MTISQLYWRCNFPSSSVWNRKRLEYGQLARKKYSSCSTIFIDDSTVSQPNLKNTIRAVALAIYFHIRNRDHHQIQQQTDEEERMLEIFDEKLHPLSVCEHCCLVDYRIWSHINRAAYKPRCKFSVPNQCKNARPSYKSSWILNNTYEWKKCKWVACLFKIKSTKPTMCLIICILF